MVTFCGLVKGFLIHVVIVAIFSFKITNYNVVWYANSTIRVISEDEL